MVSALSEAKRRIVAAVVYVIGLVKADWRLQRPDEWADSRLGRAGQMGRLIAVVVVGVVSIVGILIYDEIESALGTPSNSDLSNSTDNVTEGFGDALELVPVVMIVLIAGLVISVVSRMRRV